MTRGFIALVSADSDTHAAQLRVRFGNDVMIVDLDSLEKSVNGRRLTGPLSRQEIIRSWSREALFSPLFEERLIVISGLNGAQDVNALGSALSGDCNWYGPRVDLPIIALCVNRAVEEEHCGLLDLVDRALSVIATGRQLLIGELQ